MTDGFPPPPESSGYQPPYTAPTAAAGPVPESLGAIWYNPAANILLSIITCGIWTIFWSYRTHEDLKRHNGDGLGGVIAAILAIFAGVVIMFSVPYELEKAYQRRGWQSPESAMLGLWFLLPIIGNFIWYLKIQRALNAYWQAMGSLPG